MILSKMLPFNPQETPFWQTAAQAFGVSHDRLGLFQFTTQPKMWDIIFSAHRLAFDVLYAGPGNFPVGLTLALLDIQAGGNGEGKGAEFRRDLAENYLKRLGGDDFVGAQTYCRMIVGSDSVIPPGDAVEKNQMGEEYYPEAIGGTIRHASKVAGIPVIITENGLSSTDDTQRLEYFQRTLRCVADCLEAEIDVSGYFCWSDMDNFEWGSGYGPKFGIIDVDRAAQKPRYQIHHLLMEEGERLIGNVSKQDIMETIISANQDLIERLENYIVGADYGR